METRSAVDFPGLRRIHIALSTVNLERSRSFYETLLGERPTKTRPDYVKFEPRDPSVNLALNRTSDPRPPARPPSHFGIQVKSVSAVQAARARLLSAGIPTVLEERTTCCYAVQDKVWATDPDGNHWEIFVVTQADVEGREQKSAECTTAPVADAERGCC